VEPVAVVLRTARFKTLRGKACEPNFYSTRRHGTVASVFDPALPPDLPEPLKRVVVTPPPGHPSSEVQLNSTCT